MTKVILTGAVGFVGYHVAEALLLRGDRVIGIDNVNDYYDPRLKQARLRRLIGQGRFAFHRVDVADRDSMHALFREHGDTKHVIHLAAQAGVRHSMTDPYAYVRSNVLGHLVVLEGVRLLSSLRHLVYASSSSVYGANRSVPFAETDRVDTPLSMYAATKRADELMGHAYAHLYAVPQTGLRFFTVYGPWGRPDMAYYSFARAIAAGEPIIVYDGGRLKRDFTYIDDIVAGVIGVLDRPPTGPVPARVLNIGNHRSETVSRLVQLLEKGLGRRAVVRDAPRPAADVEETFADVAAIQEVAGFSPSTPLEVGVGRFVTWFREYHGG
jgi:UDP-glucuronate 4-epimerase